MRESVSRKPRILIVRAGSGLAVTVTVVLSLLWGASEADGHGDQVRCISMVDEPSDSTSRLVDRGENATGRQPLGRVEPSDQLPLADSRSARFGPPPPTASPALPDSLPSPAAAPTQTGGNGIVSRSVTAPPTAPLQDDGIYMLRDDGSREPLAPSVIVDVGREGGGLFSSPQLFAVLIGSKAALRSTSHFQAFEFVFPVGATLLSGQVAHPNQYALIQMYEDIDYGERTFDIVSGGLDPEVRVPFETERTGPRTYRVTPAEPLGLGEFGFILHEAASDLRPGSIVFDFGVDPR